MTFSARFETVHLSDLVSFFFLGFLMKGDGSDGEIKGGVKGGGGGEKDKRKRGGGHH